LPLDILAPGWYYPAVVGEPQNQFSLTRAALSKCGRAKGEFLSVVSLRRMGLLGALAFGLCGWLAVGKAAQPKPNIVFILADDLGWADVSGGHTTYGGGSDFYETPNVARLASEGMCFSSAYVCQNCVPTRAAILSGQYPTRTGIYNVGTLNRNVAGTTPLIGPENHQDVPAAIWTSAEMLRGAGYVRCHVGKYHVGGHEEGSATLPLNQGFDYNYGGTSAGNATAYWAATNAVGGWTFNNSVGPELDVHAQPYDASYQSRYRVWAQPLYTLPSSLLGTAKHVGDAVADAALDFMEAHRTNGVPFYLQFHEYLVHVPLQARADLKAYYDQKKLSQPSHVGHDNTTYAGMVAQFDLSVGRLLAYLNDPNGDGNSSDSIAANTLVLFFSDNGGYLGSTENRPLRGGKGMQTEGGLRAPLVAWMPGTVPHRTNDSLVQMVDFYPTLAEIAGGALPDPITQPMDGRSLVSVFKGLANASARQANYWHFPGYLDTRSRPCSTITKDLSGKRYKLHYYYEDQRNELFCLSDDLGETNDLLGTVTGQAAAWSVATNLSADLRQWLDRTGAIYPTNRATGQVVPPPMPLTGPPPRSAQTIVNVQLLNSADAGTGPAGSGRDPTLGSAGLRLACLEHLHRTQRPDRQVQPRGRTWAADPGDLHYLCTRSACVWPKPGQSRLRQQRWRKRLLLHLPVPLRRRHARRGGHEQFCHRRAHSRQPVRPCLLRQLEPDQRWQHLHRERGGQDSRRCAPGLGSGFLRGAQLCSLPPGTA
jgi:arylsulfatase A-like enzyme